MVLEIVKKELKRVFTDKRLILSSFIIPAISIYVIYSLMGTMIGNMESDIQEHESVVYVQDAPESFKSFYDANKNDFNMQVTFDGFNREDVITQLQNKDADLLVEFDPSFDQKIANYEEQSQLPEVKTFYNPAEDYSNQARNNFKYTVLSMYEQTLLQDRFQNLNYISAFGIDTTNTESAVVSEDKANASILSMMLPMLIAIMLFAGPMGIGMDTIAGEKERGTMATLLLTPAKREHIALGKVLGLGIISILSSLCYFVAIALSLPKMAGGMTGGGDGASVGLDSLGFSLEQYIMLIVIMITLVGIYVGIISLISVKAKTIKEAGTYVAPIYMIVMMAAFSTMFSRGDAAMYKFMIPIYGSISAIKELFTNDLTMQEFATASGMALVVTGVLIYFITRAFNNERVMFNT